MVAGRSAQRAWACAHPRLRVGAFHGAPPVRAPPCYHQAPLPPRLLPYCAGLPAGRWAELLPHYCGIEERSFTLFSACQVRGVELKRTQPPAHARARMYTRTHVMRTGACMQPVRTHTRVLTGKCMAPRPHPSRPCPCPPNSFLPGNAPRPLLPPWTPLPDQEAQERILAMERQAKALEAEVRQLEVRRSRGGRAGVCQEMGERRAAEGVFEVAVPAAWRWVSRGPPALFGRRTAQRALPLPQLPWRRPGPTRPCDSVLRLPSPDAVCTAAGGRCGGAAARRYSTGGGWGGAGEGGGRGEAG